MIIANITSFITIDSEAEHYYCKYHVIEEKPADKQYNGSSYGQTELQREITEESEARKLNKKDEYYSYCVGKFTIRFNSFDEIHKQLIAQFPKETIVTYLEGRLFKEMIYYKDGVNLGFKAFGEVFSAVPNSCYKKLLPPTNEIIIKCEDCGKTHKLEDVTEEHECNEGTLIQFLKKRDVDEPCCKGYYLIWNVIL